MHVLLVDDDTNFRRSLALGFETEGYRVSEAKSGMEALEFLHINQRTKNRVKGVVIDARMPGLDGFWLADQISAKYPSLRGVILSAHAYPADMKGYKVLMKPVKVSTLIDTFEEKILLASEE